VRAIVDRWLAVALALAGLGFGAFDAFAVRPEMSSFARTARRETGTVVASGGSAKSASPRRGAWSVAVDDPELGPQLADGGGGAAEGARVAVLCSTPAHRCETLARVAAYERWPLVPGMARAAALLAGAAVMAVFTRRGRPRP
jgi:hypothetical protein